MCNTANASVALGQKRQKKKRIQKERTALGNDQGSEERNNNHW